MIIRSRKKLKWFILFFLIILILISISNLYPSKFIIQSPELIKISKQVWAVYLGHFGNPFFDQNYTHWRTPADLTSEHPYKEPPNSHLLSLAPQLGYYSSHDPNAIRKHFQMLNDAGINSILCEWWGSNYTDDSEPYSYGFTDSTFKLLLEESKAYNISVGIKFQPYKSASQSSIYSDFQYILQNYLDHPQYLKISGKPVIVICDPWSSSANFYFSISNIKHFRSDILFIAEISDRFQIGLSVDEGYFAVFQKYVRIPFSSSKGENEEEEEDENQHNLLFSDCKNWKSFQLISQERGIYFIPSVSPGFNAPGTWKVRMKSRQNGSAYSEMWKKAIESQSPIILINSFNNWVDGNMIENAMETDRWKMTERTWMSSKDQDAYIKLTKEWVSKFQNS